MSKFNSTTFGEISGRHGSAVAAKTKKDGNILKVFKAPSNPKTDKQVAVRTKFAFVTSYLSCMRDLFKYTFKDNGGYNAAMSYAFSNAVTGTAPNWTMDVSKLVMAVGSSNVYISGTHTVTKTTGSTVKVDWYTGNIHDNIVNNAKPTDTVTVVFFNEDLREAMLYEPEVTRLEGTVDVELPDNWISGKAHCWIYFTRANKSLNSNSVYLSEVQL
jgi:hypothetical protein